VKIWTDGGCLNNGTPEAIGAWAFVTEDGFESSGQLFGSTNNRAELQAVIEALRYARSLGKFAGVEIYTDSQLTQFCAQGKWRRRANLDLWANFDSAARGMRAQFHWVKAHSGIPQNERADQLCTIEIHRGVSV